MFYVGEVVRAGNASAIVQKYDSETGFIVLNNIDGAIESGSTIVGEESGETLTLTDFEISKTYSLSPYDEWGDWGDEFEFMITQDDGTIITTDNQIQASEIVQNLNLNEAIVLK
jgi:hypothetical protein